MSGSKRVKSAPFDKARCMRLPQREALRRSMVELLAAQDGLAFFASILRTSVSRALIFALSSDPSSRVSASGRIFVMSSRSCANSARKALTVGVVTTASRPFE